MLTVSLLSRAGSLPQDDVFLTGSRCCIHDFVSGAAPNIVRGGSYSGNVAGADPTAGGWRRLPGGPARMATREEGGLVAGRLIYLIGPSGSGKDSLLDAARTRLAERGCRIVRRVITRSAEAVGEAALGVSAQQFADMQAQGAFALSWHANGLSYGIPREIDDWLAAGQDVLVNGSRGHLQNTRLRYPNVLVLLLTVDQAVLRQRLLARGRESLIEIDQRLARNARFNEQLLAQDPAVLLLDNSGALEHTVQRLLACIDVQVPAFDAGGNEYEQ